jgi:hypothetical protein
MQDLPSSISLLLSELQIREKAEPNSKVPNALRNKLLMSLDPYVILHPSGKSFLSNLYNETRKGAPVHLIIRMVRDFFSEISIRNQEPNLFRMESQLNELRNMVRNPPDMESRLIELQSQMDDIRKGVEQVQSSVIEKQEDMLQKFMSAEKKAFIIMPFQRDFENVWIGAIKPACAECHYASLRVDEINLSSLITDDIEKYSNLASVVVVDLTGNNPNVMFELGWALAKEKKPIVICQGEHVNNMAFDVRGIRHISYENSWLGIEGLKKKIKDFISNTDKQPISKKRNSSKTESIKK